MASDTRLSIGTVGLIVALAGATGFALGRFTSEPPSATTTVSQAAPEPAPKPREPQQPDPGAMPPGHPPVDPNTAPPPMAPRSSDEPRTLAWEKPAAWTDAPNTSSMRIATYKAKVAAGDSSAPEMTVMQAGGSLEANIERWAGQFGEEGKASLKRETRTIAGYDVTVVTTHGPYGGSMAPASQNQGSGDSKATEPYELLAAIVMTPDMPYFFKMTGPMKSVEAARKDFDALLASFKKP